MLYDSLNESRTFEVDQFPLTMPTRVTFLTRTLHMVCNFTHGEPYAPLRRSYFATFIVRDLSHVPPRVVNTHLRQAIPWRELTDKFRKVLEDEHCGSVVDYDSEDEGGSKGDH